MYESAFSDYRATKIDGSARRLPDCVVQSSGDDEEGPGIAGIDSGAQAQVGRTTETNGDTGAGER